MPQSEPASTPEKFYLTTPIYYVNARPHIGHAYTTVVADVLARRHRLLGHETFFLTGTDEHGQKIERSAAAAGIPPQQFADGVSAQFQALWDRMGLTYDRYIRTTSAPHKQGAQALFAELFRLGHIYLSSYTGSYCVSDEAFVDLPPATPCPDCDRPLETVTEENFFFRLSAFQLPLLDLIESNTLKITPEASRNEVLSFLRGPVNDLRSFLPDPPQSSVILSEAQRAQSKDLRSAPADSQSSIAAEPSPDDAVILTLSSPKRMDPRISPEESPTPSGAPSMAQSNMGGNVKPPTVRPHLAQTAAGTPYLPGALKDLSVSRSSFTWGIPVPEPAASLTRDPQVIYVWLDALANYMTAIGYGNPTPAAQAEFGKWWPADLHLVGKEITRFHCIYWPAFLLALNPATAIPAEVCHPERSAAQSKDLRLDPPPDPRISPFTQPTPKPEDAPSMTQNGVRGNVEPSAAPTWATPEAEISPEEHGLPPEAGTLVGSTPTQNSVILSEAQRAQPKDLRLAPAHLPPETPTLNATQNPVILSEAQSAQPKDLRLAPAHLPPETPTLNPTPTPVILSEAQSAQPKDLRLAPAQLPPEAHAAWATHWLPKQITANGWLLFDNSKMSKSKGNVVRTETILDAFGTLCPPKPAAPPSEACHPERSAAQPKDLRQGAPHNPQVPSTPHDRDLFAADVLRYYLLREIPFGQDGSFSFEALVTRYNADLANGYGNLVSRTLKLIQQNIADGLIAPSEPWLFRDRQAFWEGDEPNKRFEAQSGTQFIIDQIENFATEWTPKFLATLSLQVWLAELQLRITHVDAYISFHKPWSLAKSIDELDRKKLVEVLYTAAESIRILTALLHPILPYATATVWAQLGLGSIESAATNGDLRNLQWGGLQPGTKLGPLGPIFPRADKSLIETMTNMESQNTPTLTPITDNNDRTHPDQSPFPEAPLSSAVVPTPVTPSALTDELAGITTPAPTNSFDPAAGPRPLSPANPAATVAGSHAITTERPPTPSHTEATPSGIFAAGPIPGAPFLPKGEVGSTTPDQSPEITIDDFAKIDLRVAQILIAERIPKADKLLRLEVDLGPDLGTRQILSGIAEHYTPESLVGRRIVVITNLAPRKMRGLESHGMLLAANGPELDGKPGKPILATTAEDTPPGTRLT